MEGNIVDIPLKGIARAGSDLSCEDGLCNEIIGLEWKEGSYVPVGFDYSDNIFVDANTKNVWIHKTTNQDNTLVLKKDTENIGKYIVYWLEGSSILMTDIATPIERIGIVNNTIRIQDKVFLFYNNRYNELNISDIELEMQLDVRKNGVAMLHDWSDKSVQKELADKSEDWEETWVKQNLQKLEDEVRSGEYLTGMAFMRYAIKLYDGTYINLSTPILVSDTPQKHLNGFIEQRSIKPHSLDFKTSNPSGYESVVRQMGYLVNMGWKFRHTEALDQYYEVNNFLREKELYERNTMVSGDVFFREELPWNTPKSLESASWDSEGKNYNATFYNKNYKDYEWFAFSVDGDMSLEGPSSQILSTIGRDIRLPNKRNADDTWENITSKVWFDKIASSNNENWFNKDENGGYDGNKWSSPIANYNFEIPSEYCYYGKGLGLYYDGSSIENANNKIYQLFAARNLSTPVFKINRLPSNLYQYENLILSIDVFMTRPVSLFQDKMGSGAMTNQRRFKENADIKRELKDSLVAFYKIYEIPYKKIISNTIKENVIYVPYIERGRISQIEQQEVLQQSYHNLDYYDITYTYNNRLHISGITTQPLNTLSQSLGLAATQYDGNVQDVKYLKLSKTESLNNTQWSRIYEYDIEVNDKNSNITVNIPNLSITVDIYNTANVNDIPIASYSNYIGLDISILGPKNELIYSNTDTKYFSRGTQSSHKMYLENISLAFNAENAGAYKLQISMYSTLVGNAINYFHMDKVSVSSADNEDCFVKVHNGFTTEYLVAEIEIDEDGDRLKVPMKIKYESKSNQIYPIIYPSESAKSIKVLGVKIADEDGYRPLLSPIIINMVSTSNGYSWSNSISPITIPSPDTTTIPLPDFSAVRVKRNGNIFKVSSANNLIDFPLINTYQVGNGDIVGFASSTRALSQGQFGQFPLYVFTTDGIYAMEQTTTGTYSSCHPISRDVCNNPNGILQLDGSVLFTTNKCLMLLSGSEVVPFAPLLVGDVGLTPSEEELNNIYAGEEVYRKIVNDENLVELNDSISYSDFREFISDNNTRLIYIYDKNKVLVYNNHKDYCYLIDIATRISTKIAVRVFFDDGNYPKPHLGIQGYGVIERGLEISDGYKLPQLAYKLDGDEYTQTMFQTRPIKLGTYDLKSSFRVVLRGRFDVERNRFAGLCVLGSNDTEKWMYLGSTKKKGRFVDLGTTIHRVSCKYLMVIYVGRISGDSKINGLEISSNVKYNNKLK